MPLTIMTEAYPSDLHVSIRGITEFGDSYEWDLSMKNDVYFPYGLGLNSQVITPESLADKKVEVDEIKNIVGDWYDRVKAIAESVINDQAFSDSDIGLHVQQLTDKGLSNEEILNDPTYIKYETIVLDKIANILINDYDLPRAEWDAAYQTLSTPIQEVCMDYAEIVRENSQNIDIE